MIRRIWHCGLVHYLPNQELRQLYYDCCYCCNKYLVIGNKNASSNGVRCDSLCSPLNYQTQDDFRAYLILVITELELRGLEYKKRDVDLEKATGNKYIAPNASYRSVNVFRDWHTKEYLRLNMATLYEKWRYTTCIDDEQWEKIKRGYKKITGEDYVL